MMVSQVIFRNLNVTDDSLGMKNKFGLLAQLVEHIVHIDGVTGSSPVQTTINLPDMISGRFFSVGTARQRCIHSFLLFPIRFECCA